MASADFCLNFGMRRTSAITEPEAHSSPLWSLSLLLSIIYGSVFRHFYFFGRNWFLLHNSSTLCDRRLSGRMSKASQLLHLLLCESWPSLPRNWIKPSLLWHIIKRLVTICCLMAIWRLKETWLTPSEAVPFPGGQCCLDKWRRLWLRVIYIRPASYWDYLGTFRGGGGGGL